MLKQLTKYSTNTHNAFNDVVFGNNAAKLIFSVTLSLSPLGSGIRRDPGKIGCIGRQDPSYYIKSKSSFGKLKCDS